MPTLEQIVRAYHQKLTGLQSRAADLTGQAWDRFGGPDDQSLEQFVTHTVPIVDGARRRSIDLVAGYLSAMLTIANRQTTHIGIDAADILPQLRAGVGLDVVYARPVITLRKLLADGQTFASASSQARDRAASSASTDVLLANTAAAVDGMSSTDITSYRRVLSPAACELCASFADETYRSDTIMPIHNNCDCGFAPIIGERDPGRTIDQHVLDTLQSSPPVDATFTIGDDGAIRHLDDAPVDVEVRDHGELGPVLTDATHHFDGPEDLAA